MSLKVYFLHSHLDFFPSNMGDISNELVNDSTKKKKLKSCYQEKVNNHMMANYCWFLQRERDILLIFIVVLVNVVHVYADMLCIIMDLAKKP